MRGLSFKMDKIAIIYFDNGEVIYTVLYHTWGGTFNVKYFELPREDSSEIYKLGNLSQGVLS